MQTVKGTEAGNATDRVRAGPSETELGKTEDRRNVCRSGY